jgi:hypothetical protein
MLSEDPEDGGSMGLSDILVPYRITTWHQKPEDHDVNLQLFVQNAFF